MYHVLGARNSSTYEPSHAPSTILYGAPNFPGSGSTDLRHLAASLMLAQDVNLKVMQEVLGHSSFDVTMDLYSHLMPTAKKDVAARMDTLLSELG